MNGKSDIHFYTSREWDKEIGLYYYRARYYDAEIGRFISRDPIGQVDNVNLYSYVGDNPVMFTDPMGLESKYLIYVGKNKKGGKDKSTDLAYQTQYKLLLEKGVKPENILTNYGNGEIEGTIEELNEAIKTGKYTEVIIIAHGDEKNVKLNPDDSSTYINKDSLNKVDKIDGKVTTKIRLVSCNTGKGNEPIAEDLSKYLNTKVEAPNGYVTSNETKDGEFIVGTWSNTYINFMRNSGNRKFTDFNP